MFARRGSRESRGTIGKSPSKTGATLIAVLMAAGVTACGGSDTKPAGQGQAKRITLAISSDEGSLTPYTNKRGYPGGNLVRLIFDTLVVLDPGNQVKPLLAKALQTQDNKVYTLPLRTGVTWHDGKPFTAADVTFSVDYYKKHVAGDNAVDMRGVQSATASGDTVTITLERPDPEFAVRTLADMPVLPKHLWESVTEPTKAAKELAVGTGPYRLTKYEPDLSYTFEANKNYAMGKAKSDSVRVVVIPEETTQFAALRTGEIHMSSRNVPPQQIGQLEQQQKITVAKGVDFPATLLLFNNTRAPFNQANVRLALAKAIDLNELVKTVLLGNGSPGNPGFIHPEAPIKGEQQGATFDPEAAKKELDALGAKPGAGGIRVLKGKPMRFELLSYSSSPDRLRSAELIKEMLAKVGVGVEVRSMDPDAQDAKVWPEFDVTKGRNYDMAMWGWSAPVMLDTAKVASLVASNPKDGPFNVVGFKDPSVDKIVEDLKAATTMDARSQVVGRLQAEVAQKMPFVTLYYRSGAYAFRKDVFAGWQWQKGAGILHKFSLVDLKLG